ncbi:MAG: ferredoxin-NADP reductase, partial [Gammaproteobacteria bacterium]|nr:ferredoxin-NADP reductase [Gammaproteobacteria bacterium]
MRLEDFPTEPSYSAVVLSTEELTEEGSDVEIREIVLEVQNQKFEFELGQSIGVLVEAAGDAGGRERHRLYTLADTPQPGGNAEITIVV